MKKFNTPLSFGYMVLTTFFTLAFFLNVLKTCETATSHDFKRIDSVTTVEKRAEEFSIVDTPELKESKLPNLADSGISYFTSSENPDSTIRYDSVMHISLSDIDTTAILSEYFSVNKYQMKYQDDRLGFNLSAWVTRNTLDTFQLKGVTFHYDSTTTITKELVPKKRNDIFLGGFAGGNREFFQAGIGATAITKNNYLIGADIDLINRGIIVRAGIPIFGRKDYE